MDRSPDLIKFEVRGYSPDSKFMGIPIGWHSKDSVYFDSDICRFDFSNDLIFIVSGEESRTVGQILHSKEPTLSPFVGIINGSNYSLTTSSGGFLGSELNLDLTAQGYKMKRKIGYGTNSVSFGDGFLVNVDMFKKTMSLETTPDFLDVAMVVATVIHKYTMDYLSTGVDG